MLLRMLVGEENGKNKWQFHIKQNISLFSVIKKHEILPLVTTYMDLEGIMLTEMSDRERQIPYDSFIHGVLKKKTNSKTQRTDGWFPEAGGGEWAKWVKGVKRYILLVIKQLSHWNHGKVITAW